MLNQQKQNGDGFKQFLYVHPQKIGGETSHFALIFFRLGWKPPIR